jgi:hypothetical protein
MWPITSWFVTGADGGSWSCDGSVPPCSGSQFPRPCGRRVRLGGAL